MHSKSIFDNLYITKRTGIVIGIVVASVMLIVLVAVLYASAKSLPSVLNETFGSTVSENSFENSGAGIWRVVNGEYVLAGPASMPLSATGNVNASIHKTAVTANEWRLYVDAKINSRPSSQDMSILFDYTNEANYYFVNFSATKDANTNGIFKIENGIQTQLSAISVVTEANKTYQVEVRKNGDKIKLYRDKTFLASTKGIVPSSMRVGLGSRGGAVVFDNLTVGADGAVIDPTPLPVPETPPVTVDPTPTPAPSPTPTPVPPTSVPITGGGRQVSVSTADQLTAAIADAKPGDVIKLADGTYQGKTAVGKYTGSFAATKSGTADKPIVIMGSRNAIIDGAGTTGRYGLYLVNASYWTIKGITVSNATKGIVLDGSNNNTFDGVKITQTGQEGIHFRAFSSDNTIQNSEINYTGIKNSTFGEGVYIGSANSNWGTYSGGLPDKSDRNKVLGNTISFTGAESMDIKEGSTGGIIAGNTMNGSGMTGSWADSWIDVKGNNYTFRNNTGSNALLDGFQIHVAIAGWGNNNIFEANTVNVGGPGYGLTIQSGTSGTVWRCSNVVSNAAGSAVINGKDAFACV